MSLRIARIEVSPELLAKSLHLPEGTEIFSAEVKRGTHGYVVVLGVEHGDLPAIDEGEETPLVAPIVKYRRETWDFDWNAHTEYPWKFDDEREYDPQSGEPYPYADVDPYGDT